MAKQQGAAPQAATRYQEIPAEVAQELRAAVGAGTDLRRVAAWLSLENKRIIVAETLHVEGLVRTPISELLELDLGLVPLTDYGCAAVAERLMAAADRGQSAHAPAKARALLEKAGTTPTASPLLSYEPLYRDLAEAHLSKGDEAALDWLRRALAHNARLHRGDDVAFAVIDLASGLLQLGDLDEGLRLLTPVATHTRAALWVCRFLATGFGVLGLIDLGLLGARRGLQILEAQGDPDELRDEFLMAEFDLLASQTRGRESEVEPTVLQALQDVLSEPTTDLREGLDLAALVPDLDGIPVKRPMRFADLPRSVQERFAAAVA